MSPALWAWIIVGGVIVLIAIIFTIMMIPELVRYLKLKSM
jgi:membrane protein YdbS with pleckstrin-like domain